MPVAFDAVGPSSSGQNSSASTTCSWTHTVGTGPALVVACVQCDAASDGGVTLTATCGGTSMTSLGRVETTLSTGNGFLQVYWLAGVSAGAKTVTATAAGGTPHDMSGGSVSFTGTGSPRSPGRWRPYGTKSADRAL